MVRPRAGDFTYSPAEVDAMCAAMRDLAASGASGFATGALLARGGVDVAATERLVGAAGERPVTFHRAFDQVADLDQALDRSSSSV